MIATTAAFKTAIKASARRIKAKLVLSDLTLDQIDKIELDSVMTDDEDFSIGTANMDVMKIEISDDPLEPLLYSFDGKEIEVQLGAMLADLTAEYYPIGKYTVEKSDRKDNKIYLDLVDRMYKADVLYVSNLTYPTTIGQILTSAAAQAGISVVAGDFANKDYVVNIEPVYENITCRQIFGYIAELAGGYARINRSGSLVIMTLGPASVTSITGDHYIDYKKAESAPGVIDKLIVKNGTEQATAGTGTNLYTIVDNLFVQNPANVVNNIFTVLSAVNYKAGEMNWIGDFSLEMGDKVTIDGANTYILNRKLKYSGGLRETIKIPGKSNIEKNSTGKPNINLLINQIKTQIRIQDGIISQKIEDDDDRFSQIDQSIEDINLVVSDKVGSAELELLSNALTLKLDSAGSKNLIINSGFKDGLTSWSATQNTTALVRTSSQYPDMPSGCALIIPMEMGKTNIVSQIVSSEFERTRKKWVLSGFIRNTATVSGATNPFASIQPIIKYTDATTDYLVATVATKKNFLWEKFEFSFTTHADKQVEQISLQAIGRDMTGLLMFSSLVLSEGEVFQSWSNADNEAYSTFYKFTPTAFELKDINGSVIIETSKGIANEQNQSSVQNVEDGYPLNMSFRIGDTTSLIEKVELRLKQYNFRTDSKGAASGGGSTSGPSSKSTTDQRWNGSVLTFEASGAYVAAVPGVHQHAIDQGQFAHDHGMAHTHTTPAHSHSVIFGILEIENTNGTIEVDINGVRRTGTTNTDIVLDITTWVTTNGIHNLSLRSPNLKRVQCDLYIKSYIRR